MKKIWVALAVVLVVALVGAVIIIKMINKPHQNLKELKPDVTIDAPSLVIDYSRDATVADSSYLNKKVEVTGIVEQVTQNQDSSITVFLTGV
jgi:flagellar basal body-associated protein FliL